MHVLPLRQTPIRVTFDGKSFEVIFDRAGAHVPEALGKYMLSQGLVEKGNDPNPKPQWSITAGGGHGDLLPMFAPWVKELN